MLQALGLPLSNKLLAHAHWTVEQKKMSKSVGNVADPFAAMEQYGVDAVRYYMARVGGRFKDDVGKNQNQTCLLPTCRVCFFQTGPRNNSPSTVTKSSLTSETSLCV